MTKSEKQRVERVIQRLSGEREKIYYKLRTVGTPYDAAMLRTAEQFIDIIKEEFNYEDNQNEKEE